MPAAVAVPLIVGAASTGATLAGAKMASNAAKNAAKQQQAGTDQALQLQRDIYTQTRADQAPQRAISAGAIRTLGNLTGIQMGGSASGGGMAGGLSSLGQMGASIGPGQAQPAVLMRAPNGMTKRVPREQVAHFQAQGAQVIG